MLLAACTAGTRAGEASKRQESGKQAHWGQEGTLFSLASSLPFPLLTKLKLVSSSKEKIVKGPRSIFTKKAECEFDNQHPQPHCSWAQGTSSGSQRKEAG